MICCRNSRSYSVPPKNTVFLKQAVNWMSPEYKLCLPMVGGSPNISSVILALGCLESVLHLNSSRVIRRFGHSLNVEFRLTLSITLVFKIPFCFLAAMIDLNRFPSKTRFLSNIYLFYTVLTMAFPQNQSSKTMLNSSLEMFFCQVTNLSSI